MSRFPREIVYRAVAASKKGKTRATNAITGAVMPETKGLTRTEWVLQIRLHELQPLEHADVLYIIRVQGFSDGRPRKVHVLFPLTNPPSSQGWSAADVHRKATARSPGP